APEASAPRPRPRPAWAILARSGAGGYVAGAKRAENGADPPTASGQSLPGRPGARVEGVRRAASRLGNTPVIGGGYDHAYLMGGGSQMTEAVAESSAEFAERMIHMWNEAALALMVSVGHQTGLFDAMA